MTFFRSLTNLGYRKGKSTLDQMKRTKFGAIIEALIQSK